MWQIRCIYIYRCRYVTFDIVWDHSCYHPLKCGVAIVTIVYYVAHSRYTMCLTWLGPAPSVLILTSSCWTIMEKNTNILNFNQKFIRCYCANIWYPVTGLCILCQQRKFQLSNIDFISFKPTLGTGYLVDISCTMPWFWSMVFCAHYAQSIPCYQRRNELPKDESRKLGDSMNETGWNVYSWMRSIHLCKRKIFI